MYLTASVPFGKFQRTLSRLYPCKQVRSVLLKKKRNPGIRTQHEYAWPPQASKYVRYLVGQISQPNTRWKNDLLGKLLTRWLIYQIYMHPLEHSFAPLESSLETTKNAASKRHPGEKQCTGEFLCTSPNEKIQQMFVNICVVIFSDLFKKISNILQFTSRFFLKLDWQSITKKKWGRIEKREHMERRLTKCCRKFPDYPENGAICRKSDPSPLASFPRLFFLFPFRPRNLGLFGAFLWKIRHLKKTLKKIGQELDFI